MYVRTEDAGYFIAKEPGIRAFEESSYLNPHISWNALSRTAPSKERRKEVLEKSEDNSGSGAVSLKDFEKYKLESVDIALHYRLNPLQQTKS